MRVVIGLGVFLCNFLVIVTLSGWNLKVRVNVCAEQLLESTNVGEEKNNVGYLICNNFMIFIGNIFDFNC